MRARRQRRHGHRATDPLVLPALLVVAPATVRFAFARDRLAHDEWEPAYKLSSGQLWWRCVRLAAERGELHPCAERLAKHLSWHLGEQVTLMNIREVLGGYASYHHLSVRTAWTDWGRLVAAGWLSPTRAPANQGPSRPQGPGSGRAARYVLTAPAGFAIGVATVCRYVHEALDLLSVMAPTLADAVQTAACKAYVVLDGTVVGIDRVFVASRRDRPYYSDQAHAHGVNGQVLADPAGRLIWASPALPGFATGAG